MRRIAAALAERGIRAFLDEDDLRPGQPWQEELEKAIAGSGAVVVAIGGHGLGRWERQEMRAALDLAAGTRLLPVIPVLLPGAPARPQLPLFLRASTWVDLRDGVTRDGIDRLVWGITGRKPGEIAPVPAASEPRVSTSKLPVTGALFVAREDELARLDAVWDNPAVNVVAFVAMGGVGKSASVNRWLDRPADDGRRGAERVFGWSFYSQGTDATGASGDAFVNEALRQFGYPGDPITSPGEKGRILADWVRAARSLLVLDGLEPLQHPPGAQTGRIRDPAVQALVRELRAKNPGLCVITSRLAVADVAGRMGAVELDLDHLPPAAGAALLGQLGVKGRAAELEAAAAELGGHALALTILGTYLRDVCGGDVRRRKEVPLLDDEIEQGGHARRVMKSYEVWLGEGPELRVLRLLGLFDRPAAAAALAALRAEPAIAGLTEGLGARDETQWKMAVARLSGVGLVTDDGTDGLDAHPLVREYFGERLREEAPEAWRAGHERLDEYYRK